MRLCRVAFQFSADIGHIYAKNLVIGISTKYKTIPVVVQMLVGSNGNKDMGAMMAMLVLSIIPIIIFYMVCQKYIIEGVVAGAVKG